MSILNFRRKPAPEDRSGAARAILDGFSIEVMPRTAAKIDDFRPLLPPETRVYIAHIDGTPIEDMVATAERLRNEGFAVMPHFPARIIKDKATLADWIGRYADVGVDEALVLAGGVDKPVGDYHSSMQLLEAGLFDNSGYKRLHVAGHPEGNRDIDPDGSTKLVDEAAQWKQQFRERTDAKMALVTQFAFETKPVTDWAERYDAAGIDLPIHAGIAGPAKLQTLIKFSIACGVGPSLRVLQRRAKDVTKLMLPFEPTDVLADFADYRAANPETRIEQVHFFPLGGIKATAEFVKRTQGGNVAEAGSA